MRQRPTSLVLLALLLTACAEAAAPTFTPEPASATAPPTATRERPTATPNLARPTHDPARVLEPGNWFAAVYHTALQQVVLVNGGPEVGKDPNAPLELWGWDGQTWGLINDDGPPWRNFASMAYDARRNVLVVYGGLQSRGRRFEELWEWDGAAWTQHTAEGPGLREAAGMVYDAAREQVLLFGGAIGLDLAGDTWAWNGQAWTHLSSEGPPPRFPGALAYDPASEQVLLYGGHAPLPNGSSADLGDLWAWDGTRWEELAQGTVTPGIRISANMVHDPLTGAMLYYGGSDMNAFYGDTWLWDGLRWQALPATGPGPRSGHALVLDEARQRVVLYGGFDRPMSAPFTDTWEWDGTHWTCHENCPATPAH
jgi:hypothetical protein